ncbi:MULTISPECIES: outer membrane beta-barrel protein [Tenacibaculum]|uniref:Porin family protein n=1 Tax=Tenacibaculum larymnensis TaxID=2878201 RepID=A0A9X4IPJ4_9FLAO|nr:MULTISPECIES: outer membrane beta-barrel protein [Tenacibaculum]MDE1206037.1 porin family protein [Tenacibaculum larymnensis]RLK06705.1 outer membrane protein with beta-barrel domain [Tenacibaculum discolor]
MIKTNKVLLGLLLIFYIPVNAQNNKITLEEKTSSQFYVSASGGYSFSSAGVRFGTETTRTRVENTYGSYGEGLNTQLRGGYLFDENFGVEIGFGYLNGADQKNLLIDLPDQSQYINIESRGRAYGASASLVYNFTNNIYGRFGALIKLGGRTESKGKINIALSQTEKLDVKYTQDYKGRLPLGFIGAVGYKYGLNNNLFLFAELEYMGVSVTRDSSKMVNFSANVNGETRSIDEVRSILFNHSSYSDLAPIFNKNVEYVDELPLGANPVAEKQLSQKVPYSSFGINLGITYYLGK